MVGDQEGRGGGRCAFGGQKAAKVVLDVFMGEGGGVEKDGGGAAVDGDGHVGTHFVADDDGVAGIEVFAAQEGVQKLPLGFRHAAFRGEKREGEKLFQAGLADFRAGEHGLGIGEEEQAFAAPEEFAQRGDGVGVRAEPVAGKNPEVPGGGAGPLAVLQTLENGIGMTGVSGAPAVDRGIVQHDGAGACGGVEEKAEENAFDADFRAFQADLASEGLPFPVFRLPKGVAERVGGEEAPVDGVPIRHEAPEGGFVFVGADIHKGPVEIEDAVGAVEWRFGGGLHETTLARRRGRRHRKAKTQGDARRWGAYGEQNTPSIGFHLFGMQVLDLAEEWGGDNIAMLMRLTWQSED